MNNNIELELTNGKHIVILNCIPTRIYDAKEGYRYSISFSFKFPFIHFKKSIYTRFRYMEYNSRWNTDPTYRVNCNLSSLYRIVGYDVKGWAKSNIESALTNY